MECALIERYIEDGYNPCGLDGEPVPMIFNKLAYPGEIQEVVTDEVVIFDKQDYLEVQKRCETEDVLDLMKEFGELFYEYDDLFLDNVNQDDVIFYIGEWADPISDIVTNDFIAKEDLNTHDYLRYWSDGHWETQWIEGRTDLEVETDYFNLDRWNGSNKEFHSVGHHARVYRIQTIDGEPVKNKYLVELWSQWQGEELSDGCIMNEEELHQYFTINFRDYEQEWQEFLEFDCQGEV
ncbi:hypothetical protein [Eubacterium limosum]|uniref:hypothetical protein n=1 Tax=Eubacterium limosum TaxID=1736 RepID=UPI0010635979|nr:hypothetical protein [Eubacterium limosum]